MRTSRYLPALLAAFALCSVGECAREGEYVPGSERIAEMKEFYGFATWPGKDGPVRSGLKLDPGMLPEGLAMERVSQPSFGVDQWTRQFSVSRDYLVARADGEGSLRVTIAVTETCTQAQHRIICLLALSSLPCPPGIARGADFGLDLGDACYGSPADVMWARNNVFVRVVSDSRPEMTPFVALVARALDEELCRRPTSNTYEECAARPVITEVAWVTDPTERRRLGVDWKAAEVKDPNGEEVDFIRIGSRPGWGGAKLQMAVNESNLPGFPLPNLAEWKPDHARSAEFNATIDAFLSRFATPAQRALAAGVAGQQ